MAYDARRGVSVLFGGSDGSLLRDAWEWDGAEWRSVSGSGPTERSHHAMAYDGERGVAVLFGGFSARTRLGDTWEWNGVSWNWVADTGPSRRTGHAMAYDSASGVTTLFGVGAGFGNEDLNTWAWNGAAWKEIALRGIGPRHSTRMAYDAARGVTLHFGGGDTSQQGETWTWDGFEWTRVEVPGPPARSSHAMAYDSQRGVVVLFGGEGIGALGDTWEWDGLEWTQVATTGPAPRWGHAMVYDSARRVTVLFAGRNGSSCLGLGDMWEWDGVRWTHVSSGGAPRSRFDHAMSYDSARDVTVLFGGTIIETSCKFHVFLSDMWEWDGVSWKELIPNPRPFGRFGHTMAFDSARVVTVLFGGLGEGWSYLRDTWEWDGVEWTQPVSATSVARSNHAMAYDGLREAMVVFGGTNSISTLGDTWKYDCTLRSRLAVKATCAGGGPIRIEWSSATPGGRVALAFARARGSFTIPPGRPCAGASLGLGPHQLQVAWIGRSDGEGGRVINTDAPPAACGGHLQLLDLTTCATSNVARIE